MTSRTRFAVALAACVLAVAFPSGASLSDVLRAEERASEAPQAEAQGDKAERSGAPQTGPERQQQPAPPSAPVLPLGEPPQRQEEARRPAGQESQDRGYDLATTASLLAAFFGGLAVCVYAYQAHIMRGQFKAALTAAEAAKASADAARATVDLARENAVAELRAYVGTSRIYFRKFSPVEPTSVAVEIKNFGATPAHDYRADFWLEMQPHPIPNEGAFTKHDGPSADAPTSLMPGAESVVICDLPQIVSAPVMAEILAEAFALYLCGTISYRDVFGNKQHTNVRKLARGKRSQTDAPFIDAPEGNDAT